MTSEQFVVPHGQSTAVRTENMTRRGFLGRTVALGVGGSAALTVLNACAGSAPGIGGGQSVTYWNLFGGGDGERMVEMQNTFVKEHPNIGLNAVTLAWGTPYYTKLAMSAAGGRPPDVGIAHISRMPTYAATGFLQSFDLDELSQVGITQDNFLPQVWERAHFNNKLYALPLDTHPYVMFYNIDICKKAGLLDSAGNLVPLQGADNLINAFKAVQKVTGGYGLAQTGAWRLFWSLYSQLGGQILSPDAKELVIDDGKAEQSLAFMADLTQKSKVTLGTPDYGATVAQFGNGKAGFYWNGEWEITTFITQKMNFSMVPFPNVFGNTKVWGDSHSFILPHNAYPDKNQRMTTLTFISSMLKESLTWAKGGHIPAYLSVASSSDYKNLKPQSNYAQAAGDVIVDPPAWFSGAGSQFEAQGDQAFQAVMLGQLTPQQAITQFKAGVQHLINTPSPVLQGQ